MSGSSPPQTGTASTATATQPSYFAKVGMMLVQIDDPDLLSTLEAQWDDTPSSDAYYETLLGIHQDVENVLRNCPDVRAVKRRGELRKEYHATFDHHGVTDDTWFLSDASAPLAFEVFIPKAEREYSFEVRYEEAVVERVRVLYTGSQFIAFTEVDESTSPSMLGQEIREFLVRKLQTPRWHAVPVPPCPLHPNVRVQISPENERLEFHVPDWTEIRISVPEITDLDIEDFFEYFLSEIGISTASFCSAATLDTKLTRITWKLQETLDALAQKYRALLSLPWYRIAARFRLMHSIRVDALELQLQSNDFVSTQLKLEREQRAFSSQSTDPWHRTPFLSYFAGHFHAPEVSVAEMRKVVGHMTDTVTNKYIQYYTVLAAILGGVVGAVVTQLPSLCIFIVDLCTREQ